jgi:hypothetical protein
MAWCFTEEATEFTKTMLSRLSNLTDSAVVPALSWKILSGIATL